MADMVLVNARFEVSYRGLEHALPLVGKKCNLADIVGSPGEAETTWPQFLEEWSRGCEFCDIIIVFGRRPRLKTSAQVIAELEAMRKRHMQIAFIVDGNLIGNKIAVKKLLRDVAASACFYG